MNLHRFITGLTHVLAVDCGSQAGITALERRLAFVASMRREYDLDETCWTTVHCVHGSNPLTHDDAADVAMLWREYLHQGLYVPTTGSHGDPSARRALRAFAAAPRLVSQVRVLVRPPELATPEDLTGLAEDLRVLEPLWDLPADRLDTATDASRLQLVVPEAARTTATKLLREAGLPATHLDDPRFVVPDHRPDESRTSYGIRTTGELFSLNPTTLTPYTWDQLHVAATRAGWAA